MLESPFVSVIVVNWNGSSYIEECIQSLLSLSYKDFEIIVVDNNSTDNSVEVLKKLKQHPKLKLIFNKKNIGFSQGCNLGIRASKGKIIALFNNDAKAEINWLRELVTAIQRSDKVGAASGPIYYYMPPNRIWFAGGKVDGVTGFFWHIDQYSFQFTNDAEIDTLSGCAIAIKREVLSKIGLLDEGYFLYGDDVDLSFSIKRLNMKLLFVPTAISWHMVSASKKKAFSFVYEMKQYSDLRVILKNFPKKYLLTALVFRCIFMPIAEALYFYKNPRSVLVTLKAFLKILKNFDDVLMARKQINSLGKLVIQNRFKEVVYEAKRRIVQKRLFW